jgi:hypothetical protein
MQVVVVVQHMEYLAALLLEVVLAVAAVVGKLPLLVAEPLIPAAVAGVDLLEMETYIMVAQEVKV